MSKDPMVWMVVGIVGGFSLWISWSFLLSIHARRKKPPCLTCGVRSKFVRFTSYTGLDEIIVYRCPEGHLSERG